MTTKPAAEPSRQVEVEPLPDPTVFYELLPNVPLPDPPPRMDLQNYLHLHGPGVGSALARHFERRATTLVISGAYLVPQRPGVLLVPDLMVAFDVDAEAIIVRNGYVISEVGKPPDFVLEVASTSTGRNDYTAKRGVYAYFGVTEYWRFDPTGGRRHDAAIWGDTLVNDEYQAIPLTTEPDGVIWGHSAALGLDLCWDNGHFRIFDPESGEYLPTPDELAAERDAAAAERDAAVERVRQLEEQLRNRPSE